VPAIRWADAAPEPAGVRPVDVDGDGRPRVGDPVGASSGGGRVVADPARLQRPLGRVQYHPLDAVVDQQSMEAVLVTGIFLDPYVSVVAAAVRADARQHSLLARRVGRGETLVPTVRHHDPNFPPQCRDDENARLLGEVYALPRGEVARNCQRASVRRDANLDANPAGLTRTQAVSSPLPNVRKATYLQVFCSLQNPREPSPCQLRIRRSPVRVLPSAPTNILQSTENPQGPTGR
jgi:hypothetical protein